MRVRITHPGAGELKYEIRSIVEFANKLEKTGIDIIWENIGDPIAKGEEVPKWIRQKVADETLNNNDSFGYSPTKGLDYSRQYLARTRTDETGNQLNAEDIIFFNGLGDAIHEVYTWLSPFARVLGPSPAYPTHSSIEGAHARSRHQTYNLDPQNSWLPDMNDLRDKVHFDAEIAGLLIINPDNPTGMIYTKEILKQFVELAKKYNLFLVADEIYANLAFDDSFVSLAEVSQDVPTMIMRGLSKEVPWPGSRCGWVEFYNTDKDEDFARYAKSIEEAKMNEVCSTTLPQSVLPKILNDKRYSPHLESRRNKYIKRAKTASDLFGKSKFFDVVEPKGAFYLSVTFSDLFYKNPPKPRPVNEKAKLLLERELKKDSEMPIDKKFCLQLLGATGICTVPLSSGFNSHIQGFRMTLLEEDEEKFEQTINKILEITD